MKDVLKFHNVQLEILSPVHIGDGSTISKKEYLYDKSSNRIKVFDIPKLFNILTKKGSGADNEITRYLLEGRNSDTLAQLLRKYSINSNECIRYELEASVSNEYDLKKREINSFVKDAYGLPYVPGSTIKGLLKSAIVSYKIYNDNNLQRTIKTEISKEADSFNRNKKSLANEVNREIEGVFDKIIDEKKGKKEGNIIRGFSGLVVSDSRPITDKAPLILAQKVDYSLEGDQGSLPIYKESLKPGIKVDFSLTIDTQILNISVDYIKEALDFYQKEAYQHFYKKYGRGEDSSDIIWIGGGAGFTSKTIIYQLFGSDAPEICNKIFSKTLGEKIYYRHKHDEYKDELTPHTCKCTIYQNELYDMGKARIRFLD